MLNIERYKEEILEEFTKGDHLEQCIHEVAFRHGAFQPKPGVNIIYAGEFLDWLTLEYKEPILDDKEKEYLSNVIKPFKDDVIDILKEDLDDYECITIYFKEEDGDKSVMSFPIFKKGTMYKGMKRNKEYTLEELGL